MSRMPFPFYLSVGTTRLHPHTVFESLAYVVGFQSYLWLKKRHEDVISPESRWQQIAASVMGAALGSRILGMLQSPNEAWIASFARGKTVVGAILGAWIAVGWVKKKTGIVVRTGDLYAVPLTLGVIVGRIGCFLTGLSDETYGTATTVPWAVDFGDGIPRHPTQLYEILFLIILCALLGIVTDQVSRGATLCTGDVFRSFVIAYMSWRLLIDFWKPETRFLGLSVIQWACVATLFYCLDDLRRIMKAICLAERQYVNGGIVRLERD